LRGNIFQKWMWIKILFRKEFIALSPHHNICQRKVFVIPEGYLDIIKEWNRFFA
jgi:hypothetical protein